jgi:hypothetical protein
LTSEQRNSGRDARQNDEGCRIEISSYLSLLGDGGMNG